MASIQFYIRLFLIVAITIILSDTGIVLNKHKKEFPVIRYSQINIMSCQDMASLTGGTAGSSGTCDTYTGSCYGCTRLSASQCNGSSGSCTNNCFMPACKCGGTFFFIDGCL